METVAGGAFEHFGLREAWESQLAGTLGISAGDLAAARPGSLSWWGAREFELAGGVRITTDGELGMSSGRQLENLRWPATWAISLVETLGTSTAEQFCKTWGLRLFCLRRCQGFFAGGRFGNFSWPALSNFGWRAVWEF